MKKKKSTNSGSMLEKYKAKKTKGDIANTGIKTLVDLVLGATLGAGLGATSGRAAVPVGILMIAGSHYFEEETGVLRAAGAASIAYGIGKAIEHKTIAQNQAVNGFSLAGETSKAKTRLSQFKDELMSAYYIDKVFKKKEDDTESQTKQIGSIDMSVLNEFDRDIAQKAFLREESEDVEYEEFEDENEEEDFDPQESEFIDDDVNLEHI